MQLVRALPNSTWPLRSGVIAGSIPSSFASIGITIGGEIEAACAYSHATDLPKPGKSYGASKALENRSWQEVAVRLGLAREVAAEK